MKKTILRNRSSPTKFQFGANCTNTPQRTGFENDDVTFNDSGCYGSPSSHCPDSLAHWDVCTCRRESSSKKLPLWQTLPSPAKYLRNKWKGRASFVEDESLPWIAKLGPQKILQGLVVLVIVASFGFTFLTYTRHIQGLDPATRNQKYKSIEFGVVKRSIEMEEHGKLIKDIVDEEGNLLGGKKAAIQFGHDLKMKPDDNEDDLDLLLQLEAQLTAIRDMLKENQEDSELVNDNEELFKETFIFASDNSDSAFLNKKKRDVKDGAFRFGSDPIDLELVNDKKRDVKDGAFRFASDPIDLELVNDKKRDVKEDSFRLASDNEELELSSFNS